MSKYGNCKTVVDNVTFDSRREANRYCELRLLQRAGVIFELKLQVAYPLRVNGHLICTYVCDFQYLDKTTGEMIVEDSKGMKLPLYSIKRKLMLAIHKIRIFET